MAKTILHISEVSVLAKRNLNYFFNTFNGGKLNKLNNFCETPNGDRYYFWAMNAFNNGKHNGYWFDEIINIELGPADLVKRLKSDRHAPENIIHRCLIHMETMGE